MRNLGDKAEKPRFFSVNEAARILRMSPMTLYRAINSGSFPAIRVRGRLTVPAGAIDKMEKAALYRNEVVDAAEFTSTMPAPADVLTPETGA
ncbi:helix-turn-helix domain-containing protein [Amycolatopsis alba]|uniref:Helix-turn-helix domain-containing protein n=1 Tax=Amycolatopsis alba DSM 44262 TaxID=1125972 RepID=A0A229R9Y0_AMYAL|nr:helix-turn-helix domain-containing protein [Amycolatopsis alba]OXM43456.1 helix-turn-helix domain-containing protein [Amycolatopsis alba DSM 44262]